MGYVQDIIRSIKLGGKMNYYEKARENLLEFQNTVLVMFMWGKITKKDAIAFVIGYISALHQLDLYGAGASEQSLTNFEEELEQWKN